MTGFDPILIEVSSYEDLSFYHGHFQILLHGRHPGLAAVEISRQRRIMLVCQTIMGKEI